MRKRTLKAVPLVLVLALGVQARLSADGWPWSWFSESPPAANLTTDVDITFNTYLPYVPPYRFHATLMDDKRNVIQWFPNGAVGDGWMISSERITTLPLSQPIKEGDTLFIDAQVVINFSPMAFKQGYGKTTLTATTRNGRDYFFKDVMLDVN
jgi:hypothetical protein